MQLKQYHNKNQVQTTIQLIFFNCLSHLCLHGYQVIVVRLNQISENSNWIKEHMSRHMFEVNIYITGLLKT